MTMLNFIIPAGHTLSLLVPTAIWLFLALILLLSLLMLVARILGLNVFVLIVGAIIKWTTRAMALLVGIWGIAMLTIWLIHLM